MEIKIGPSGSINFLILTLFVFLSSVHFTQGIIKRCYSCRSRGELGNCKDPFPVNGTAKPTVKGEEPQLLRGVETIPCASGWCSKMMEGGSTFKDDDYGIATHRMCLQRQPSDGEERCAYITRNNRKVFACFCQGDLCNSAPLNWAPNMIMTFAIVISARLLC
ncbi:uncharacterized protein LOC132203138 [Neocloeon triangulifer]|uniref:uncharacterized protein LOC132203138 n=1 Tax=Neocloeon triangulifer TaxID=2078957 RepID=UPI00286F252C|nr:uncharacterized protein LOC132203138 [Neocloeon triangulifer]